MKRTLFTLLVGFVWLALLVLDTLPTAAETRDSEHPERVAVGQTAPTFELESIDGEPLRLESLRGDKPLVLVFFRGTW